MGRRVRWGWGASSSRADTGVAAPFIVGFVPLPFERKKGCAGHISSRMRGSGRLQTLASYIATSRNLQVCSKRFLSGGESENTQ